MNSSRRSEPRANRASHRFHTASNNTASFAPIARVLRSSPIPLQVFAFPPGRPARHPHPFDCDPFGGGKGQEDKPSKVGHPRPCSGVYSSMADSPRHPPDNLSALLTSTTYSDAAIPAGAEDCPKMEDRSAGLSGPVSAVRRVPQPGGLRLALVADWICGFGGSHRSVGRPGRTQTTTRPDATPLKPPFTRFARALLKLRRYGMPIGRAGAPSSRTCPARRRGIP